MGLKVTGISETKARIENDAERSSRAALREVERGAKKIVERARRQAPVDEGNLENAIKILGHDRGGLNRRKRIVVGVDGSMPVPERPGKTVGDYAGLMHENLQPYGIFELGEKSRDKQRNNPDVIVGGKFLERAAQDLQQEIAQAVLAALRGRR
mgnify:CR=1 FL=1